MWTRGTYTLYFNCFFPAPLHPNLFRRSEHLFEIIWRLRSRGANVFKPIATGCTDNSALYKTSSFMYNTKY